MPGTVRGFQGMNRVLLAVVLAIILLAAVEITARISLTKFRGGYPVGMYVYDSELGFRYRANFTGSFQGIYRNITIRTNSEGFKDYEHSGNSRKKDSCSGRLSRFRAGSNAGRFLSCTD